MTIESPANLDIACGTLLRKAGLASRYSRGLFDIPAVPCIEVICLLLALERIDHTTLRNLNIRFCLPFISISQENSSHILHQLHRLYHGVKVPFVSSLSGCSQSDISNESALLTNTPASMHTPPCLGCLLCWVIIYEDAMRP